MISFKHIACLSTVVIILTVQFACAQKRTEESLYLHSPRKASIYSAAIPGAGQIYNKKYWKVPIVYAGLGVFTYIAINNHNEFNRFKNAYILRSEGGQDEFFGILSEPALINEMDRWRKFRDYNIIGGLVIYVLQIVDANVDANLYHFDVSDDLSFGISKISISDSHFNNYAAGLTIVKRF